MEIPKWLSHKPIVAVDYEEKDACAGDARFLSIGRATWNHEDCSAKIFRWAENGQKWSRQSEELPLWRVLDLASLLLSTIKGVHSGLDEEVVEEDDMAFLRSFLNENMETYLPRIKNLERILSTGGYTKEEKHTTSPNIFDFATSELSQDAILAWIMQWADPSYEESNHQLFEMGQTFVRALLNDSNFEINSIEVGRQWQNIDLWAEINEDTFLIIEDKTETSTHDNQLKRYKDTVETYYAGKRKNLKFIYLKTGNEPLSVLRKVESDGYNVILRNNLLALLSPYVTAHPLIADFILHLQEIELKTTAFLSLPVFEWDWYAWQGFYSEINKHIDLESWSYVANPAGGFLGAWWNFVDFEEVRFYLQFEEKKLCFKIEYEESENRTGVRNKYYDLLMNVKGNDFPEITRPERFGAGTYMTIAVVDPHTLFGDGVVDIPLVIQKLKSYEDLIQKCKSLN